MLKQKIENVMAAQEIEKARDHIRANKNAYIAGSVGLVVGGVTVLITKGRTGNIVNTVAPVINNTPVISPVFNNDASVNFGGYATKFVKCLETGDVWETVKEAATDAGSNPSWMSKHLNGHTEHINGKHYKIVGMGTTG